MTVSLCIPVFNPPPEFEDLLRSIAAQSLQADHILLADSSPLASTEFPTFSTPFHAVRIDHREFNHGGTRRLLLETLPPTDIVVFLTQDAILADPQALATLVRCFADETVGAAYGRQLPRPGAGPIEAHARLFNYPGCSRMKTMSDVPEIGIKTAFISNSFAAYRRSALAGVGGFPRHCIVSEDTFVAARMLLAGWKIAYCADARAYHSHPYTWRQEFQRYFDIGVFHAREPWVRMSFGGAEGEGWRFLRSELRHLAGSEPRLVPSVLVRAVIKYSGFRAGLRENLLPAGLKRRLSAQKAFWDNDRRGDRLGTSVT